MCVGVLVGLSAGTKSLPGSCCVHLHSLTKALGSLMVYPVHYIVLAVICNLQKLIGHTGMP